MTNYYNKTVYIGVTNNLIRRVEEHRSLLIPGFTQKYKTTKLVYYEIHKTSIEAINREKQLKKWSRNKKNKLVESINPKWKDLYDSLYL